MKIRIHPPIVGGIYLLLAFAVNYFLSIARVIYPPYNFLGIVLIGVGITLGVWAFRLFKISGTTHNPYGVPMALITTGPFNFSRNPMYLGLSLVFLGIAIFVGTVPLFFAPVAFVLTINTIFIPREEERLKQLFGQIYLSYKMRVRRWL